MSTWINKTRERRWRNEICLDCPEKEATDGVRCKDCAERHAIWQRKRILKHRKSGRCACGRPSGELRTCTFCLEKKGKYKKELRRFYRSQGRCQCGQTPTEGTKTCAGCKRVKQDSRERLKS